MYILSTQQTYKEFPWLKTAVNISLGLGNITNHLLKSCRENGRSKFIILIRSPTT
jgi:hypothetical protein